MGPLIILFWISGYVCPGFQNLSGSLTCMLHQPKLIDVIFVEMLLPGAEARRQTKTAPGKTVQGAYLSLIIRRPR